MEKTENQFPDYSPIQALADSISQWSDATFGEGQRTIPILHHLKKEVDELITACGCGEEGILWEFADCMMLLMDAATHHDITMETLMMAVQAKLEVNKQRKWGKPDENGVVEHIRDAVPYATMQEPKSRFKISLSPEEFRQVKDLLCEGTLYHEADVKQHYLIEAAAIMVGSKKQLFDSATAQGYTLRKGRKP